MTIETSGLLTEEDLRDLRHDSNMIYYYFNKEKINERRKEKRTKH